MTQWLPRPRHRQEAVTVSLHLTPVPHPGWPLTTIMNIPNFSKMFAGWIKMWRDLDGDKLHVVILFFLYCLQGIPLGLDNAIPLILSRRNVPYTEQATFSISTYPFSMKVRPDILGRDSNYFDFSTCFPLVLCFSFIIATPGK